MILAVSLTLFLVCLFALLLYAISKPDQKSTSPVYVRKELMTPAETRFYGLLKEAFPLYDVSAQVGMSALIDAKVGQASGAVKHALRAKFSQKRLDFVLVNRETGKCALVVELDDKTHDAASAKARDAERDRLLRTVGYKVLRFDVRAKHTVTSIREAVNL